jgi:hypothetical protein
MHKNNDHLGVLTFSVGAIFCGLIILMFSGFFFYQIIAEISSYPNLPRSEKLQIVITLLLFVISGLLWVKLFADMYKHN